MQSHIERTAIKTLKIMTKKFWKTCRWVICQRGIKIICHRRHRVCCAFEGRCNQRPAADSFHVFICQQPNEIRQRQPWNCQLGALSLGELDFISSHLFVGSIQYVLTERGGQRERQSYCPLSFTGVFFFSRKKNQRQTPCCCKNCGKGAFIVQKQQVWG